MNDELKEINESDMAESVAGIDSDADNSQMQVPASISGASQDISDIIDSDRATLVTLCIDSSGSMGQYATSIIKFFRDLFVPKLSNSSEADSLAFHLMTFSDVLKSSGFRHIDDLPYDQYRTDGNTALYDAIVVSVNSHLGYLENLKRNHLNPKSIYILMTDGQNTTSIEANQSSAKKAIERLKKKEHDMAYFAFGTSASNEAQDLGIPQEKIYPIDNLDREKLGQIFGVISRSIVATSSGARKSGDDFIDNGSGLQSLAQQNGASGAGQDAFSNQNAFNEDNLNNDFEKDDDDFAAI